MSVQNGIDNLDKLTNHYGSDRIMGGNTYIESFIQTPGVVVHTGQIGRIIFGELSEESSRRPQAILHIFQKASIQAELTANIQRVLWEKFLFICGVHGVSTLCRAPLGEVLATAETRELLIDVMGEVQKLARKNGVTLGENAVREAVALSESYKKGFKCSMLRDLDWRRPIDFDTASHHAELRASPDTLRPRVFLGVVRKTGNAADCLERGVPGGNTMAVRVRGLIITLALGIVLWPLSAGGQQPGRVYRIGVLLVESRERLIPYLKAFKEYRGAFEPKPWIIH